MTVITGPDATLMAFSVVFVAFRIGVTVLEPVMAT